MTNVSPRPTRRRVLLGTAAASLALALAGAPRAAEPAPRDDAAIDAQAQRIHKNVLVLDSHVDIPEDFGSAGLDPGADGPGQVDLPKLERGGVAAAVFSVYAKQRRRTPEGTAVARAEADRKLKAILDIPKRYPHRAELARTAADVARIRRERKVAVIVGFLNAAPVGKDLDRIDALYKAGVRTFGFVHAGNNEFADSSRPLGDDTPDEHGGLSPLGREAVDRLNKLGVIVDVSQLSTKALLETVRRSKAPVVASHSGVKGLVDTPRNLSDEELDAIKANGGVVQIVAFSAYLKPTPPEVAEKAKAIFSKKDPRDLTREEDEELHRQYDAVAPKTATVSDLVDSIDYAVKRVGIDHVGVSSDFNHGGGVIGWNDESGASAVTRELVRRGYTEEEIGKLWGGNFLRVFRAVEAAAARPDGSESAGR